MRSRRSIAIAVSGLLALTLVGCEEVEPADPLPAAESEPPRSPALPESPEPAPVPEPEPQPEPEPEPASPQVPSSKSVNLAEYYRRLQANLLDQGLLREDAGEEDAPISAAQLARDFIDIALYDEYPRAADMLTSAPQESVLRRWEQPIRMRMVIGPSVSPAQAARDRSEVGAYAARLSRLTGVPITSVEEDANFHVAVLSEDDRAGFADELRNLVPGLTPASVRSFTNVPVPILCLVLAFGSGEGDGYSQAVALIRAEHPDRLRTACIHEELAQGMGLANDSPTARPSIFNDSEEFARLTRHDELLLRILYDPRLETGMTIEEAKPVVGEITNELVSGGPS